MSYFTLDLETVPSELALTGDAFEIASWEPGLDNGAAPLMETGVLPALHPVSAHIVSASFGGPADTLHTSVYNLCDYGGAGAFDQWPDTETVEAAERRLVRDILERMHKGLKQGRTLITFNGKGFDLWLLRTRAMILTPLWDEPLHFDWQKLLYPYSNHPHCDLRLLFGNGNRFARGTLDVWARAFGVEARSEGHLVWDYVRAGEWDKVEMYGHAEAKTLCQLYERVKEWT